MSSKVRHIGKYCIPFYFNDRVIALRVTNYTTCDDVIEMVLQKEGVGIAHAPSYVIHEKTAQLERVVTGRSLVVKVWRSWGCESSNFRFIIRCKQQETAVKKTGLQMTDEGRIDGLFINNYKNEVNSRPKLGCSNPNHSRSIATSNLNTISEHEAVSDIITESTRIRVTAKKDKSFIFMRFFNDLKKTNKQVRNLRKRLSLSSRKTGDGTEDTYVRNSDVSEPYDSNMSLSSTLHERCQYLWDKYSLSDTDSNSSGEFSLDDEQVTWFDHDENGTNNKLDNAFVKSSCNSDSDEGIDVTSMTSFDLNAAFVGEADATRFCLQSSLESLQETTDVCELERNISNNEYIKQLFGKDCTVCEDDEMDSFMCSTVDDL